MPLAQAPTQWALAFLNRRQLPSDSAIGSSRSIFYKTNIFTDFFHKK
jgi:hypothetical protein